MNTEASMVSRVARLKSLTAEDESGGQLVLVEESSEVENVWLVRTLVPPNSEEASEQLLVDIKNLEFYSNGCELSAQITMDCSNDQYGNYRKKPRNAQKFVLTIRKSTIIRGDFVPLDHQNLPHPTTRIWDEVVISGENVDIQIDFEDIIFDIRHDAVVCDCGKISFRRCIFRGGEFCVYIGNNRAHTNVLFESCLFEQGSEGCVVAFGETQVTMVNCTFRNIKSGVMFNDGANASIIQCCFRNAYLGAAADSNSMMHLEQCRFVDGSFTSIFVGSGVDACIKDCRIIGAKEKGIEIMGSKRIIATIENCVIQECGWGIMVRTGKTSTTIANTSVARCTYDAGVLLQPDIIGDITFTNCTISNNAAHNLANVTGPKCEVVIDGVVQPTKMEAVTEGVDAAGLPIRALMLKQDTSGLSLNVLRALKIATGKDILCFSCKAVEPTSEKFKACAKCENACYCSRECQVAHWAEHKLKCTKSKKVKKG